MRWLVKMERRSGHLSCWCLLLFLLFVPRLSGQPAKENPLAPKPERGAQEKRPAAMAPHELSERDLDAFFGGMLPMQIAREDIAGMVVSVVKDGKPFFRQGYGFANLEKRTPVSAENTLFRPGSISKLFTWTAIMQQVEQGRLDLDRDVNDYLDFKIPPTYAQPITLRNIMTHTPGFEETVQELFVENAPTSNLWTST